MNITKQLTGTGVMRVIKTPRRTYCTIAYMTYLYWPYWSGILLRSYICPK